MRCPSQSLVLRLLRVDASCYKDAIDGTSRLKSETSCLIMQITMAEQQDLKVEASVTLEKPQTMHTEHHVAEFQGGQKISRRLTDDSLHHDHPINLPQWRKTVILITLAWSGFLANFSASGFIGGGSKVLRLFPRHNRCASCGFPPNGSNIRSHSFSHRAIFRILIIGYRCRSLILQPNVTDDRSTSDIPAR